MMEWVALLSAMGDLFGPWQALRKEQAALNALLRSPTASDKPALVEREILVRVERARQSLQEIQSRTAHIRHPFAHEHEGTFVSQQALSGLGNLSDPPLITEACRTCGDRLCGLYGRVLGRLVLLAEKLEALALQG
ncbi:MAG: hypothetical protein HY674_20095 [Chloroflexi bacterium]|nr:hypothetical protein [Chloroflexota bacterium]